MVRQGVCHSGLTLALFLAAWTFAGATTGFAQDRSSVSVGARVVDARAAWAAHAGVQAAVEALSHSVTMTDAVGASVLTTGYGAGAEVELERARAGARPGSTGLAIRRVSAGAGVRIRVDYAAN